MNGKTIFDLMVCIMAGQPLQSCCFRASGGATTSFWRRGINLSAHTFFITKLRGRASKAVYRMISQ